MNDSILSVTEVEDTHNRLAFLDSGAVHHLPLFYFEGIPFHKKLSMCYK